MEKKKAPLLMLVKMSFEPRAEERTPISDFVLGVRRNGPVEHSLSVARSLYFSSVVFSPGQVLSLLNNPRVQPVPTLGSSISAIWINSEDIDFFSAGISRSCTQLRTSVPLGVFVLFTKISTFLAVESVYTVPTVQYMFILSFFRYYQCERGRKGNA